MIALTLRIRSLESDLWLELVAHRFRRFESVRLPESSVGCGESRSIVWMPRVGSVLMTATAASVTFQAVARDEAVLAFIREALNSEVSAAVPESVGGRRLVLEWDYPRTIPAPLRS